MWPVVESFGNLKGSDCSVPPSKASFIASKLDFEPNSFECLPGEDLIVAADLILPLLFSYCLVFLFAVCLPVPKPRPTYPILP